MQDRAATREQNHDCSDDGFAGGVELQSDVVQSLLPRPHPVLFSLTGSPFCDGDGRGMLGFHSNTGDFFKENTFGVEAIQKEMRRTIPEKELKKFLLDDSRTIQIWACQHQIECMNYRILASSGIPLDVNNHRTTWLEKEPKGWHHWRERRV